MPSKPQPPPAVPQFSGRALTLQESIESNIESQQRELADQILLQDQQKREVQNRELRQLQLQQLQQHQQLSQQLQKARRTEHLDQLQDIFAQQRRLKVSSIGDQHVPFAQATHCAPLPFGAKYNDLPAAGAAVSRKSQGGIAKPRTCFLPSVMRSLCRLRHTVFAGLRLPTSKEWRAIEIIATRYAPSVSVDSRRSYPRAPICSASRLRYIVPFDLIMQYGKRLEDAVTLARQKVFHSASTRLQSAV